MSKSDMYQLINDSSCLSNSCSSAKAKRFLSNKKPEQKIQDNRSMSDKLELLLDSVIANSNEANLKLSLDNLLADFVNLHPTVTGCTYTILMNGSTYDVLSPIQSEVRGGKLTNQIGKSHRADHDETRLIKIINNFESFKDILNDT